MKTSNNKIKFFTMTRELVDLASSRSMALNHKGKKFNFGYYTLLLHDVIKELDHEDIDKIYPNGLNKTFIDAALNNYFNGLNIEDAFKKASNEVSK